MKYSLLMALKALEELLPKEGGVLLKEGQPGGGPAAVLLGRELKTGDITEVGRWLLLGGVWFIILCPSIVLCWFVGNRGEGPTAEGEAPIADGVVPSAGGADPTAAGPVPRVVGAEFRTELLERKELGREWRGS